MKSWKEGLVKLNVNVEWDQRKKLKEEAYKQDVTISAVVRKLIDKEFKK